MTVLFVCAALEHPQQWGSHTKSTPHPALLKGLLLYKNNTHKREHVSLQHDSASWWTDSVVPPVSQNVFSYLLHLSVGSFFLFVFFFCPPPLSLIIWRCPQKAIYLFLLWLYDVFTGEAVWKSVQRVSPRMKKERKVQILLSGSLCWCALSWCKSIKSSVFFRFVYKRVFLSLFCCKEERMYKLGLYQGDIWRVFITWIQWMTKC